MRVGEAARFNPECQILCLPIHKTATLTALAGSSGAQWVTLNEAKGRDFRMVTSIPVGDNS